MTEFRNFEGGLVGHKKTHVQRNYHYHKLEDNIVDLAKTWLALPENHQNIVILTGIGLASSD